jgi:D-3-phosphoglycerate dehydrogenase
MRILLTTTSYQDNPGKHHDMLESTGYEVVRKRGPLTEEQMLELVTTDGGFDGILHGDDHITRKVIEAALPRLRVLSKYGIGLDSVDLQAASDLKVPVLFTPGVNHTTVAEHTIGLIVMVAKNLVNHASWVNQGQWKRTTGYDLAGKTIGILGLGRIGKEVAKRAAAFEMKIVAFDLYWDDAFAAEHHITRCDTADDVVTQSDVIALHMNLTDENRHYINAQRIATMKDHVIIVNCSRGGLINEQDVAEACKSGKLLGYATDVLEVEPMQSPHPFESIENIIVTPHIGSRTFEAVQRQAVRATMNLQNFLEGKEDYIQANKF